MIRINAVGEHVDLPSPFLAPCVVVASMPWVFTQHQPIGTSTFISEAKRRGFDLDLSMLRELYRHNLLVPFIYVNNRQVGPTHTTREPEPRSGGTLLTELRYARDRGRLSDLSVMPFKSRLRFESRRGDSRHWWNGLIYSWHQLLVLPRLQLVLEQKMYRRRHESWTVRLPSPDEFVLHEALRFRRIAINATALEARYLPNLDPEWVHLSNAEPIEWERYRETFDPVAVSNILGHTTTQAREDAEFLLHLAYSIDPLSGPWSQLARRSRRDSWQHLKDAALSAIELRETAEILLRYYEDLVDRGAAEPLPEILRMAWHPLTERLSCRQDTLDQNLMRLGLSPHPRVVLAVEGETEEMHVPKVWAALGYPEAPELMRVLKLGGVDRDLEKVAALAAAPLVGTKAPDGRYWSLIKPPTRLMVAVDLEGKYFAPGKVEKTRTQIINEIRAVLKAQGVQTTDSELDELVEIRTWSQSCYEFAHFTDEELADGIMRVHATVGGLTRDGLVESIARTRSRGHKDIKEVWSQWEYKVNKIAMAETLWPVLERKIEHAKLGEAVTIPEIVNVVQHVYWTAQRWRYPSFVLTTESDQS